jgi:predicted LPLAT superfamily acyltransferase
VKPVHWAELGESTFVWGMRFLVGVHNLLGRVPFLLVLYPVVFYYRSTKGVARQASMEYLQRMESARGALGGPPGWRQGLRHFLSFGDTLLDKILSMSGRYRFDRLRFFGVEAILAMIARGQGGLFITAHMGCLEMCQAAVNSTRRIRLNVLVHTAHAEQFNRLLGRLDPDGRVRLLQVTDITPATAVLLSDCVARGEFVAIAGDRVPVGGGRTVRAPFLGHEAEWPVGPYVLAGLLKCPLYLMACLREGDGYAVHFDCLAEEVVLPRKAREEVFATLAARFAQRIETLLAKAPYEWFNFFPFWGSR